MNDSISRFAPHAFALLRIVAGVLFAMHGSQKLLGFPGDKPPVEIMSLMGLAGIIELAGGLLIAIGLLTRPAAFLSSGTMAVAYFMAHAGQHPLPIINQGETAVLYCFVFLYIWAHGAGIWSVDSMISRNRVR
ncbi:DoxX family protein [Hymenobacter psychrotolerans]|uniref:Putative oxidoreductase n=1 Tax=Hymenobacter psychrotolerans DSM 18569 TaxID=1121959 RepID=A0A1M6TRY5_9BACT|nr:DoxX family protein [Hymenobacter psychrotolerans]SHK59676.1 putative oxidoreductase [Hymenobacter psychrotolerans DSM 18569]